MLQTESETRDNRKVNIKVYRFILYVLSQDGVGREVLNKSGLRDTIVVSLQSL